MVSLVMAKVNVCAQITSMERLVSSAKKVSTISQLARNATVTRLVLPLGSLVVVRSQPANSVIAKIA